MNVTEIQGVSVSFPFKPYQVQIDYMKQLIKCLQEGVNGVLESPTGTGKTLCLLCASLAWLETKKAASQAVKQGIGNMDASQVFGSQLAKMLGKGAGKDWDGDISIPKIIYCSRTHSQLGQAINELKKTSYNHMKATVIASRDQLCIHPEVKKEENSTVKRQMCMSKVSSKTCFYYNNVQQKTGDAGLLATDQVRDIEDLVSFGSKHNCCPYFAAREMKNNADIIFMPYNYLIDSKARHRHDIQLKNSIVIFDEAHNIASVCESSSSVQLKSQDLATAISEVTQVMQSLSSMENEEHFENSQIPDFTLHDLALLKVLLCEFEQNIDQSNASHTSSVKDGRFLYEILQKIQVTHDKKDTVIDLIDKVSMFLTTTRASPFQRKESALLKFAEVVRVAYSRVLSQTGSKSNYESGHSEYFKVYLHPNLDKKQSKAVDVWASSTSGSTSNNSQGWILDFWCFNPGLSMEDLVHQEVRSIILTSGTLTPLQSFAQELGISFPVKLENPHVVKPNQIWSGVVRSGPDKTTLNSTYKNRSTKEYLNSLGRSIVNISRLVPGGVLVFFPSYRVMEDSVQSWQENDIWTSLNEIKKVFVEPRSQIALNSCMELYYEAIEDKNSKGAMFFAVCRGKVSEGLDFANNYGRAVIITGLPYPPLIDQRVCLKKQYLDDQCKKSSEKGFSGDYWYQMEATRAVNQAIGRVIRHNKDYGAVILCDERFDYTSRKAFLPSWLRSKVQSFKDFGPVLRSLVLFYKNLKSLQVTHSIDDNPRSIPNSSSRSKVVEINENVGAGSCLNSPDKQVADESNLAADSKFISSYKHEAVNSQKRKSLFESIYEDEDKRYASTSQIKNSTAGGSLCRPRPKRKLRVVPNSRANVSLDVIKAPKDEEKAGTCQNEPPLFTDEKLSYAKTYLDKVKSKINSENYREFTKIIQNYRSKGEFQSLVTGLASIFTESESLHEHFLDFIMFVKPCHKKEFRSVCFNLTGLEVPTGQSSNANS